MKLPDDSWIYRSVLYKKDMFKKIKSLALDAGVPMYKYLEMVLGKWIEYANDKENNQ